LSRHPFDAIIVYYGPVLMLLYIPIAIFYKKITIL
jgi:hypothetical protein